MSFARFARPHAVVAAAVGCFGVAALLLASPPARAQQAGAFGTDVLTYHNDNTRVGQQRDERVLTPATVNANQFGKLFTQTVDGQVYTQPLVKRGVEIPGQGRHDVVYVATENDSVYAFDADSDAGPDAAPLWHVNFLDPAHGVTPVPIEDVAQYPDIVPVIGITGTPVIDPQAGTIFLVAKTKTTDSGGAHYQQYLHALDITTGAERAGSPVLILPSVPGTGDGSKNGVLTFDSRYENQRPGLMLVGGTLIVVFAAHADTGDYHGWLLGYDPKTLKQTAVFNTSPNGTGDGIWQGGAAPAADGDGNLYFETGNGAFDPAHGSYGNTFIKLSPAPGFKVLDFFTPFNQNDLNQGDKDLGSGGVVLLPDTAGTVDHPHLIIGAGKESKAYLVDRDDFGKYHPDRDAVVQSVPDVASSYGVAAYFNGTIYYCGRYQRLKAYPLAHGLLAASPGSVTPETYGFPGATPSISSDGDANGIVWAIEVGKPGILHAYDAVDLAHELYNSHTDRDQMGDGVKFSVPTIINGKVYAGTLTGLTVYGLLHPATALPQTPTALAAAAVSDTRADLTWKLPDANQTGTKIERSLDGKSFSLVTTVAAGMTAYSDTTLAGRTKYAYRVRSTNTLGDSEPTEGVAIETPPGTPTPGLIGHWALHEGTGIVAYDTSGLGHVGSVEGEVTWIAGVAGPTALSFHGVGHAVSDVKVRDDRAFKFKDDQSFTIAAWVNAPLPGKHPQAVIAKADGAARVWGLWVTQDGKWQFGGSQDVTGPAVTPGWHHVTLVQDGAAKTRKLYLDGALAVTGIALKSNGKGDLWFGASGPSTESFAGALEDVRLYDRALAAPDIAALAKR